MKMKMKNLYILLISILSFTQINGQYCTGGPSSAFDSNVESVFINGDNNSNINYTGCPGVIGIENQTANTVSLTAGLSYSLDIQFGTCSTIENPKLFKELEHWPLTTKDVFIDWAWKLSALKKIKKSENVLNFFMFK